MQDRRIQKRQIQTNPGALQRLLSGLENQWTLWPQIRAFQESRGRLKEGDTGKPLPPTTKVEVDGPLGPTADQDLGPGSVVVPATSGRRHRERQGRAAQTQRGEPERRLRPGPLRRGNPPQPPWGSYGLGKKGTRWACPSPTGEKSSPQPERREPPNHPGGRKGTVEEVEGPTGPWQGNHRARAGS